MMRRAVAALSAWLLIILMVVSGAAAEGEERPVPKARRAATADPSRKYGGLASLPYIYKEIYRFPGRHRHGRDARLSIHGKPRGGADTEGRGREHVFGMDRRQGEVDWTLQVPGPTGCIGSGFGIFPWRVETATSSWASSWMGNTPMKRCGKSA